MHDGTTLDQGGYGWRKSSYSAGENGNCVEVGLTLAGKTLARDSKENGRGPVLEFEPGPFQDFVNAVKAEEFPAQP
ncbi:DUF397 domain-containing protein [Kitasatospora sp. NBC_01287]|uniref:DUF397 domain-containing protein n=1 Tax=Kitasatospora sp. NBC_01287 TaxID=2903573 RepID=UPI002B1E35F8|nr:DUF397 domain-containing protein [Kitasatospora sp. NBC_01287]